MVAISTRNWVVWFRFVTAGARTNGAEHQTSGVMFRDLSTSGDDREKDACPNCGTRVESTISAPGEPLREATERRCPNCAKVLRREVGGQWTVDETAS